MNSFESIKKQIEAIRTQVQLANPPLGRFGVPTPYYPPGQGLQTAVDIVERLYEPHYAIVFLDKDVQEMSNWVVDEYGCGSLVQAVISIPNQTPWGCEHIGVYHVDGEHYERTAWYSKFEFTQQEWRKTTGPG